LIIFRAIQALGGAILAANSPAILTKSFPSSQRGQALGLQATMTYLGLTIGPSLGGFLTDQLGWRSVFYINIPVGLLAFFLSLRFILQDENHAQSDAFDILGAVTFMVGLILLLLGLNQGHAMGWTSPIILGLLSAAILLFLLFHQIERRSPSPMLDLSLFSKRLFSASVANAILNYICVYSIMFLMPFYLLQGRGLNPSHAGLVLSAMPIVMAVVAPISGIISDRIGTRWPSVVGMTLIATGLFFLSRLGASSSMIQVMMRMTIAGFGIGVFISPNNSALMGSAPQNRQGIAAGVMATSRNIGMVLGVGLSGAVFTTLLNQPGQPAGNLLFSALHTSFLTAAGFACLGIIISLIRPSSPKA
jgi:EmrB/QacA subfamily drug resistance transporter